MFYKIAVFFVTIFVYLLFSIRIVGKEYIPTNEGFVVASNHRTNFDPIFLAVALPQSLKFMAKEELFQNKLLGFLISHLGAYPISRGKGDTQALEQTTRYLNEGHAVLIFPEGTRSKTGQLRRPKSGAVVLAQRSNVGILPITIDYGKKLSFRTRIYIRIHPLMTQEELAVDPEAPSTIRDGSRRVMETIASGMTLLPPQKEDA